MDTYNKSNKKLTRVVIYLKDIQQLTGKSYRHAINLNKEIRTHFNKKQHQFLTTHEFAEYTGINIDIIKQYLK